LQAFIYKLLKTKTMNAKNQKTMEKQFLLNESDLQKIIKNAIFEAVGEIREQFSVEEKPEKLLTTPEACKLLHCSAPTIIRWKKSGIVPFIKIGGKVWYRESDLKKLIGLK